MKSEDIRNRQWTEKERQALRRAAVHQIAGDDSQLNLEDIPRLSEQKLASMVRLHEEAERRTERRP